MGAENKFIEIPEGQSAATSLEIDPQKLATFGISTCIAVIVNNPKEQRAYLGHFALPGMQSGGDHDSFQQMLEEIRRTEATHGNLSAWLGGGSLSGKHTPDHQVMDEIVLDSRDYTVRELGRIVPKTNIEIRWLENNRQMEFLSFDLRASPHIEYAVRSLTPAELQEEKDLLAGLDN